MHSLCRRHHRLKTFTPWRYQRNADGSITWTSPSGQTTTRPAAAYATPAKPNGTDSPDTG